MPSPWLKSNPLSTPVTTIPKFTTAQKGPWKRHQAGKYKQTLQIQKRTNPNLHT